MRVLFLETYKQSPISIQIALPFTYLTLSSYVKERCDKHEFFFHSYQLEHLCGDIPTPVSELIERYTPDVVMVSAYTSTFYRSVALLEQAKVYGTVTVIGGIFAHDNAEFILNTYPGVDIVVRGEGEVTLFELLNVLYYEKQLHTVPGIVFREKEVIIRTQGQPKRVKAADLPLLDLSNLPIEKYKSVLKRHYLFGSRGCQFHCDFCTVNSVWNWKVSLRQVEHVKQDLIAMIRAFGVKAISLVDSNITTHKQHYPGLLSSLTEAVPEVKFAVKGRVDELTPKYLEELQSSGANHISIGIETPLASQLRLLSKTQKLDDWSQDALVLLDYAHKIGFPINFNLILGTPEEDEMSLHYKVDFATQLYEKYKAKPFLSFMTPHPGTSAALTLEQDRLRIIDTNWENYDHLHPVVIPSSETDKFIDLLLDAYKEISFNTDSEQINPISLVETKQYQLHERFPIYTYSSEWRSKVNLRQIWAAIEDRIGSKEHHEFDENTQIFQVKSTFDNPWPFHYGFLPGMSSGDGEQLDIAIFSSLAAETGQLRRVRIIGMAIMIDGDNKVFGVFPEDMEFFGIVEYENLSEELKSLSSSIFERNGPRIKQLVDSRNTYQYLLSLQLQNTAMASPVVIISEQ